MGLRHTRRRIHDQQPGRMTCFRQVYVLNGRLRLRLGDARCTLGAGDSAQFDSTIPHRLDYCHRQMLDAIRYLVAGGILWRAMPADFPAWGRGYAFTPPLARARADRGVPRPAAGGRSVSARAARPSPRRGSSSAVVRADGGHTGLVDWAREKLALSAWLVNSRSLARDYERAAGTERPRRLQEEPPALRQTSRLPWAPDRTPS